MGMAGLLGLKILTQKWLFYKGSGQNHDSFLQSTVQVFKIQSLRNQICFNEQPLTPK